MRQGCCFLTIFVKKVQQTRHDDSCSTSPTATANVINGEPTEHSSTRLTVLTQHAPYLSQVHMETKAALPFAPDISSHFAPFTLGIHFGQGVNTQFAEHRNNQHVVPTKHYQTTLHRADWHLPGHVCGGRAHAGDVGGNITFSHPAYRGL